MKKKKAEQQAKKKKPKKDLINSDCDEPDHGDGQDVNDNDNTKMQQPQFTKDLDLAAEDIYEEKKK